MIHPSLRFQFSVLAAAALLSACGGGKEVAPDGGQRESLRNASTSGTEVQCEGKLSMWLGAWDIKAQFRLPTGSGASQADLCNFYSIGEDRYVACEASVAADGRLSLTVQGVPVAEGAHVASGNTTWLISGFNVPMSCQAPGQPLVQAAPTPPGRTPPPPPPPPPPPAPPPAPVVSRPKVPPTGILATQCYEAGSNVLVACTSTTATALNGKQDGHRGSDFYLSYSQDGGNPPSDCVKDDYTGLVWEVKPIGSPRDVNLTYTNFDNPNEPQKFGVGGVLVNPTQAEINASTNSVGYVNYVNSIALCGYTNWRLPTREELHGLVNYSGPGVTSGALIAAGTTFANTLNTPYWTLTPFVSGGEVWAVDFSNGELYRTDRDVGSLKPLRLVRNAPGN